MQNPLFLTPQIISSITQRFQTPVYVYSESELRARAQDFLDFPSAFGHTVRYAMKANPQTNILAIFSDMWLHIDASSDYEALRAIASGISPHKIQLSSQEMGQHMKELVEAWVFFVATSLHQLETFGKHFPWKNCGVRINPGVGSGAFKKIDTGGLTSSFGIWHEKLPEIQSLCAKYDISLTKLHFHIGSENTPESWVSSAEQGFEIISQIETIDTFDMWWGQKMAIMPEEKSADLQSIGNALKEKFEDFYNSTGRKIHLEMEPGKYLVINSCSMITTIQDIVDTGAEWYTFLKIDSGMNDMPRVAMYGVQEPIFVVSDIARPVSSTWEQELETSLVEMQDYVVVGHCCESSDILTSELYQPEILAPRTLNKASIGDILVVDGVGAYNSAMAIKNYNSFPESGEILITQNGEILEIRKRQWVEDMWKNEVKKV